jgi:hypothetical protein
VEQAVERLLLFGAGRQVRAKGEVELLSSIQPDVRQGSDRIDDAARRHAEVGAPQEATEPEDPAEKSPPEVLP